MERLRLRYLSAAKRRGRQRGTASCARQQPWTGPWSSDGDPQAAFL